MASMKGSRSQSRSPDRPTRRADPAARLERALAAGRERFVVLVLLAGMIALRVLFLAEFWHAPNRAADAEFFLEAARRIAGGDPFLGRETFLFSPFYSYFLAAIFAIAGEQLSIVLAIQCAFGVGAAILLWRLARNVFGPLSGLLTLGLHLFCGIVLFFEGQLMDATFSVDLAIAFLWAMHRAGRSGRSGAWLGAGVLLGLFALARPNVLLFTPFAAGWAFRTSARGGTSARGLTAAAGLAVGTLLCILPFTGRNWIMTRELVLITAHGGINFYVGNNENATGFFTPPAGMPPLPGLFNREVPKAAAELATGRTGMKDGEVSDYWFARGLAFIREHPSRWFALTLMKIRAFLNGREIPINVEFDFFRELSRALRIAFLPMGVLLPLGLLGLVRAARRGPEQSLFVLWFVVCSASVVLFFVASRYRLPVVPVLLLHGGFAIRELLADLARPARFGASVAALAALLLFSNSDLDLRLNPAYVAHSRGYTLETMERWEGAIAWYERALAADPRLLLTHVHLARIHARRGDAARAGEHYEAALRLAPEDPGVRAEVENFREHVRARGGG
jgi:hypothetical protein